MDADFYRELEDLVHIHEGCTDNEGNVFCFELIKEIVDGRISKEEISESKKTLAQKQLLDSIDWFQSMGITIKYKEELIEVIE